VLFVLCTPLAAHAGVYKCVDSTGKATYSDKPCRGDESRAGMDVKGMTYSSDEVIYSNEKAAGIMQQERELELREEGARIAAQGPVEVESTEKPRKPRAKAAAQAGQGEKQNKARNAGIQNGGTPWVPVAGGAIDPRTGEFKVDAAGGYVDAKTGKFIPSTGK
jgi:hypothetical protein